MNKTVLLVEDERRLREIVSDYFRNEGFEVIEAEDGKKALELFAEHEIDLIMLDIMLPEIDGWSVCRRIRKESAVPIIMLTARSDEDDTLLGFELGADEYVTKPFSPKVLVARAKTLLKRADGAVGVAEENAMSLAGIEVNRLSRTVLVDGEEIILTHKEFELLVYLMENKGIVLSRQHLLDQLWGYDYYGDDRTVDTHIKKLRNKLGDKAKHIGTVIRVGYKFEE
ncbi:MULTISPECIES: response regulator transcription factor [Bacillus]|jgi:two-component system, OmpR family, response regulator|uniref:Two-component response regulator n=33 Tax=Bacillus cereus group TaxID=86661 RepID=Q81AG7_BACCR|nr:MULTISPECIES: response regulator transcription factor [Bacillus]AFU14172.1 two-component response regulator [Bacillus thuringiensis MC28]ANN33392.1 DNA-binding response regulator [Bacillus thuringiensis serovar coreanensis]EAO54998.1 Two-component response regulator [Bacillus thuringiensis serovar israelensis ATCC 35646]EEL21925.1 Two-component response regulator [Bacillus cereus Rock1-3]EEL33540.1 Two-component response regulator [Bacillus cereus Rock3-28]EEL39408.1 Two-component response